MCLGLTAVKFALDQRPTESMALLAAAAILDALDGRIARLLKATSRMGEEIDSLADAVNFGVAPAFIVYSLLLSHSRIGWIVVLLYAVCIVLRLARFNALLDADLPAYTKEYFVGMPAPAVRSAPSARSRPGCSGRASGGRRRRRRASSSPGWWGVPCWSSADPDAQGAHLRGQAEHGRPLLAMLAIGTAAAFVFPYLVILLIIAAYVIHIPFAVRSQRWVAAHPEAWNDRPRQQRARAGRSDAPSTRGAARWPGSACVNRGAERCPTPRSPTPRAGVAADADRALEHFGPGLPPRCGAVAPGGHRRARHPGVGRDLAHRFTDHRGGGGWRRIGTRRAPHCSTT